MNPVDNFYDAYANIKSCRLLLQAHRNEFSIEVFENVSKMLFDCEMFFLINDQYNAKEKED